MHTMARMRFLKTLRLAVLRWLGIDTLATAKLIAALELAERTRHAELLAVLNRIDQRMTIEHINPSKNYVAPVLDWETVQAIALHDLEKGE